MKIINGYAGGHRHLITVGRILAAVSAFMGLVPFYDLWRIIRIALIVPSGGGKNHSFPSCRTVLGRYGRRITLGGMDISQIDPETLFSAYSIVFQDVTLFNQSVRISFIRMHMKKPSKCSWMHY